MKRIIASAMAILMIASTLAFTAFAREESNEEAALAATEVLQVTAKGSKLPNTYAKIKNGQKINLGYLGGSVTNGYGPANAYNPSPVVQGVECWRGLSRAWLQDTYGTPNGIQISETNSNLGTTYHAGLGGTGVDLNLYRADNALGLSTNDPVDLLFIEFSINDAYEGSTYEKSAFYMESLIRMIREKSPTTDIVIILTTDHSKLQASEGGTKLHLNAQAHVDVAEYYNIPWFSFGGYMYNFLCEKNGGSFPSSNSEAWLTYMSDGCHPSKQGYAKYFEFLRDNFLRSNLDTNSNFSTSVVNYTVPSVPYNQTDAFVNNNKKYHPNNSSVYYNARLRTNATDIAPGKIRNFGVAGYGYNTNGGVITNEAYNNPGMSFSVKVKAQSAGIYYKGNPTQGLLQYRVDGGDWKYKNMYTASANQQEYFMFFENLPEEEHIVDIIVRKTNNGDDFAFSRLFIEGDSTGYGAEILEGAPNTSVLNDEVKVTTVITPSQLTGKISGNDGSTFSVYHLGVTDTDVIRYVPKTSSGSVVASECASVASVSVPDYQYAVIKYYYELEPGTSTSNAVGNRQSISFTGLKKESVTIESADKIVLGGTSAHSSIIDLNAVTARTGYEGALSAFQLYPYGNMKGNQLASTELMNVESVSFYSDYPYFDQYEIEIGVNSAIGTAKKTVSLAGKNILPSAHKYALVKYSADEDANITLGFDGLYGGSYLATATALAKNDEVIVPLTNIAESGQTSYYESVALSADKNIDVESITFFVNYPNPDATFAVSFDANGGSGNAPASVYGKIGEVVNLPEAYLKKDNKVFLGWGLTPDATEALTSVKIPLDGITLYAIYIDVVGVYLSSTGSDDNNGLSQDKPVATLAKAYELLGDSGNAIYVSGTYALSENVGIEGRKLYVRGINGTNAKLQFKEMQMAGDVVFENLGFNVTSYPSGTTPNVVTNKYNVTFGEGATTSGSWGMPMYLTMTRWSVNENDVTLDFLSNSTLVVNNIYLGSDVDYSGYKGTLNFNFGGKTSADKVTLGRGVSTSTSIEGTINYNLFGNSSINTLTMGTMAGGGAFTLKGLRYIKLSDNAKVGTVYLTAETAMAGKSREGVTVLEINGGTITNDIAINADDDTKRVVIMNNGLFTKADGTDLAVNDSKAVVLKVAEGGYARAITENKEGKTLLVGFEITAPEGLKNVVINGKATEDAGGIYTVTNAGTYEVTFAAAPAEIKKHNVTFNFGNGDAAYTCQVETGNTATFPENPTREGYNFIGWANAENATESNVNADTVITKDEQFYAVWEKILVTGKEVYVSANGNDENDGLSADTPVATLTKAYEILGETGNTVYIIGTYTGSESLGIAGRKLYIKGTDSTARIQRGTNNLAGDVVLEKIIIHISATPSGLTPNFVTNGNSLTIGKGVTTAGTWGLALQLANFRWSNGTANINLDLATDSYLIFNNMLLCVDADYSGYTGTLNFNLGGTTSAGNVYLGRGHSANQGIRGIVNYNLSGESSISKLTMGSGGNGGQVSFAGLKYITVSDSAKIGTLYMTAEAAASGFTRSGVAVLEINGGIITNDIAINADDATNRVVIMNNGLFTKADSSELAVNDDKAIVLKVEKGGFAKAITTTPTSGNSYACELLGFTVTPPEEDAIILIDGAEAEADENGVYAVTSAGVHNITFKRNIKSYTVTIEGTSAEFEEGTKFTLPEAPAKDDAQHYTFKWTDGENTYDASSEYTVTKNVTLTAQWTVKKYTVTILDNAVTEDYNTVITLPATVENASEDYIYNWYDETNGTEYELGASYTIKGNATIILKQAKKVYTVYVDGTGGADTNDGLTAETAVATLEKAYELLGDYGNTVYIVGTYTGTEKLGIAGRAVYIKGTDNTAKFQRSKFEFNGDVAFEDIIILISASPSALTPNFVTGGFNVSFGKGVTTSGSWGMRLQLAMVQWTNANKDITLDFKTDKTLLFDRIYLGADANYAGYNGTLNFNFGGKTSATEVYLGRGADSTSTAIKGTINYNITDNASIKTLSMGSAQNAGHYTLGGLRYITLSDNAKLETVYMTAEAAASGKTREGVTVLEINGGTITNDIAINADDDTKRVVIMNNGLFTKADGTDLAVNDTKAVVVKVSEGGHAKAVTEKANDKTTLIGITVTKPSEDVLVYIDGTEATADENGVYSVATAGIHTVEFKNVYKVTVNGNENEYVEGTKITLPDAPAKENAQHYTFKWSDGTNTYDAKVEYTVNGDVTFTEVWTAKSYDVTVAGNKTTSEFGSVITLPASVSGADTEHYTYMWYDETNSKEYALGSSYTVSGNATIVAKQTANKYTVKFGTSDNGTQYDYNTTIILADKPAKENAQHYTFKWSDGKNSYDAKAQYTVIGDVTFTAVWTPVSYIVTFKNGNETVSEETKEYGSTITAPATEPAKEGHYFVGWYNGDEKLADGATVAGNVTYTAKFNPNSYNIEISVVPTEGGKAEGSGKYEYGNIVTLKATANKGYAFEGWYDGDSKVSESESFEVTVSGAKAYTARFVKAKIEIVGSLSIAREEGSKPYNVTYDDGTTYNSAARIVVYSGEEIVLDTTEDENAQFSFTGELGKYRVVIIKNGYLTYDNEINLVTGDELNEIALIAGDIKADFDDECGDGIIDIDDFVRVLRGFSKGSSAKVKDAVDVNEDGIVNVTDLALIKVNYNKTSENYR